MVCEKFLLLHFKSRKISVIIFLGLLLMELHFQFMNVKGEVEDSMIHIRSGWVKVCISIYI